MFSSESKRSANFSTQEVEYLVKLVNKKKSTIECKKTDRTTAADKLRCWMEIEDEFNAQFQNFRSYKTLKIKYDNLKKNAKKNYAMDKKEFYKTGGGAKAPSNVSEVDQEIIQMLEVEQVEGLASIYDDDQIENEYFKCDLTQTDLDEDVNESNYDELPAKSSFCKKSPAKKWEKYTPKMLREPKSSALVSEKRKSTKDVWADVARMKLRKIEVEIKVLEEEAKLKKRKLELEIEEIEQRLGEKAGNDPGVVKYPKEF